VAAVGLEERTLRAPQSGSPLAQGLVLGRRGGPGQPPRRLARGARQGVDGVLDVGRERGLHGSRDSNPASRKAPQPIPVRQRDGGVSTTRSSRWITSSLPL